MKEAVASSETESLELQALQEVETCNGAAEREVEELRERVAEVAALLEEARDETRSQTDSTQWDLEKLCNGVDVEELRPKVATCEELSEAHSRELAVRDERIMLIKEKSIARRARVTPSSWRPTTLSTGTREVGPIHQIQASVSYK